MRKILIISNNPGARSYENCIFVDGTFDDVLRNVRDHVYLGHRLISSPLGASARMFRSPYRSVAVSEAQGGVEAVHCAIVEGSLEQYRANMAAKKADYNHSQDYRRMDLALLETALQEASREAACEKR